MQVFQQQDVTEMLQILMSQLESRAQGTPVAALLPDLLIGRQRSFTSSTNIDYETSRTEEVFVLSLNIHGHRTLQESLAGHMKVDTWNTGAEDVKRGVILEALPPVLHLQLKRYQYDINQGAMVKFDEFFEFPEEIDLSPYLAADVDRSESWKYAIYGVVAHSGGIAGGQFYVFLRPGKDGQFYKFDDDRVTKATLREAVQNNFGAEDGQPSNKPTAYMLIYIRKSRLDHLLGDVTKDDVSEHIGMRPLEF